MVGNMSLQLHPGEILHLAGPNGAGKTTLMRALCGLLYADYSRLEWNGMQVSSALEYADELLYIGHRSSVRDRLTVHENLQWLASLNPAASLELLPDLLQQIKLAGYEDELASSLSAGQKRRVALARLQFSPALLWVLDEPFASLDVEGVELLQQWITRFVNEGGSVLYSTHQRVDFPGCHYRRIDMQVQGEAA